MPGLKAKLRRRQRRAALRGNNQVNIVSNMLKQAIASRTPAQRPARKTRNRKNRATGFPASGVAAAYSRGQKTSEPRFLSRSARGTRIVHRELVTSITGSETFSVQNTLPLNPGMAVTFPWLSTQAIGWEQYRFNTLRFCYYTRCATSTPGSMMLVPDYDAADAAPSTEQIASSYRDVVEEVPWTVEFCCNLDPKSMMEPGDRKYIRQGDIASTDIKTYDGGNFFVCTTDGTAVNWGKLWVEYDVEFFVPQLPPTGPSLAQSAKLVSGGTVSKTAYLGSVPVKTGDLPVTAVTNTMTFAATGQFLIESSLTGTGFAGNPTLSGTAASSLIQLVFTGPATAVLFSSLVNVTAPGQTFVLDYSATSTTITAGTTRVAAYSSSLL